MTVMYKKKEKPNHTVPGYQSWQRVFQAGKSGAVKIDDRWYRFAYFFEDMGARPAGSILARRDEIKPYSKENCYWKKI